MNRNTWMLDVARHCLVGVMNFNGRSFSLRKGWRPKGTVKMVLLSTLLLTSGLLALRIERVLVVGASTMMPAISSAQRAVEAPQAVKLVNSLTALPSASLSALQIGGGCGASFIQPTGSPVSTGRNPQSIVMADFNLDGKPDLAVGNRNSGNLTILLGNSNGGFLQPAGSPLSVGDSPSALAVGDFNLDGKPDLAVAVASSNNVIILLGNASGGFSQAPGSPVNSGGDPLTVTVGDFNLDGKPDLATGSNNVTILLGNGSGGFTQTGSPVNIGYKAFALVVGDFNLDGKPDLAAANSFTSENVMILLGNGSGGFSPAPGSPISVGASPSALAIGDFNLDGRPDLAVTNLLSNNLMILLGNGSGGFSQAAGSPVNTGIRPRSVVVGDFNLDGNPDLATANMQFPGTVTILLGNGSGSFSQAASSPITTGIGSHSMVVGDLNLDGKPDLAVANNDSNNVTILLNTCNAWPCGNNSFTQPGGSPINVGSNPRLLAVGDFNADGRMDLSAVNAFSNSVSILLSNGMGSFSAPANFAVPSAPLSIAVGDFNLDNRLDLVVTVANASFNYASVLLGNGMGGFSSPTNFAVDTGPRFVVVGDFNSDGRPDLATANGDSANVSVLLGNGMGSLSAATNFAVGAGPNWMATCDFNADGKLDLAVANSASTTVSILLGNGMGGFSASTNLNVGVNPGTLAVGDVNSDGRPDLITGNFDSTVSILLGNGIGNFSSSTAFSTGASINRVAVGDFNLDGKLDIVVASTGSSTVSILRGNGLGEFSAPTSFPVGESPTSVSVGDFNLDGKPDLAVTNSSSHNVTILLNTCAPIMPPTISKAFGSPNIALNSVTSLTFTISNPNTLALTGVAFTDNLPAGLVVATPNGLTGSCGGTVTATTGSGTISLVSGRLEASSSCTLSLNVTGITPGTKNNTTGAITANETGPGLMSNTVSVVVNPLLLSIQDPAVCIGPGNVVNVTLTITNAAGVAQNVTATATLPPQLLALPNTCVPNVGNCTVAGTVNYSAMLAAGQTATITYQAQVADNTSPGASLCITSAVSFNNGVPMTVQACTTVNCPVVGPGTFPLAASSVSAQKAGSVLVYNLYASSAADANTQNTRISITNTHSLLGTAVHLFFVDGSSCAVADSYLCLTPNQTATFLVSDVDPGTAGYVIAVATDFNGCPRGFNYLIGDEFVKLSSGHAANLGAEAFAALAGGLPFCDANSTTAVLNFDGVSYNMAPRTLALDNVPSRADGNDTLLVLNRFGGNLATGAATLGAIFGLLYDDAEQGLSFSVNGGCQLRGSLSGNFFRTTPRFETFIPAGRSGWLKFYSQSDIGILGATINFNGNAGTQSNAFNQGHNLHKLSLTPSGVLTIPVFPPSC